MPGVAAPRSAAAAADGEPIWDLIELLFFAYRDFVSDPDHVLEKFGFGRAHHRVLHFVNRNPGMKVADLLETLRITKQSLGRVLKQLVDEGYVVQKEGPDDRRHRLLFVTPKGEQLAMKLAGLQTERITRALGGLGPNAHEAARAFLAAMIDDRKPRRACCASLPGPIARAGRAEAGGRIMVGPAVALPDDAPHLLVVDDDRRIRDLLSRFLFAEGYRVTTADNAADARAKLESLSFDLLVLDVMMPGETGFQLAKSLREILRRADPDADREGGDRKPHHRPGARRRRLRAEAVRAARIVVAHRQHPQAHDSGAAAGDRVGALRRFRVSSGARRVAPRRGGDPSHRSRARHAARARAPCRARPCRAWRSPATAAARTSARSTCR